MSAYITKLEIPGFSGGIQLWKNHRNTVESGGSGSGSAMSADCFTLSDTVWWDDEPDWYRVENAAFINDTIRLDYGRRSYQEDWDMENHSVVLSVTPEYEGFFPETITFQLVAEFAAKGDDNGIHLFDHLIHFTAYDSNIESSLGGWTEGDEGYQKYEPYDSGVVTLPLTYGGASTGLRTIVVEYSSGSPS